MPCTSERRQLSFVGEEAEGHMEKLVLELWL